MPLMTYKISLADAAPPVDGRRTVPFRLDPSSNALGAGLPPETAGFPLELSIRFDRDGMVETREGDVTVNQSVEAGAQGVEIVLDA